MEQEFREALVASSGEEAKRLGYEKFNNCPHFCISVPDGMSTISVRTSEGKMVTFAFCSYEENGPPKCIDIKVHGGLREGIDKPSLMKVSVRGQGSLYYPQEQNKEDKVTLVIVPLDPK